MLSTFYCISLLNEIHNLRFLITIIWFYFNFIKVKASRHKNWTGHYSHWQNDVMQCFLWIFISFQLCDDTFFFLFFNDHYRFLEETSKMFFVYHQPSYSYYSMNYITDFISFFVFLAVLVSFGWCHIAN